MKCFDSLGPMRRDMTLAEWVLRKDSLGFLQECAVLDRYSSGVDERLAEYNQCGTDEAWRICLSVCDGDELEAEREMVELGYLPPTFEDSVFCAGCGPVLVRDKDLPCPWCCTVVGQAARQIYCDRWGRSDGTA